MLTFLKRLFRKWTPHEATPLIRSTNLRDRYEELQAIVDRGGPDNPNTLWAREALKELVAKEGVPPADATVAAQQQREREEGAGANAALTDLAENPPPRLLNPEDPTS